MESCSIETASSIPANGIPTYVSLGLMIIITTFTIYALARILDWSRNKPFPTVVQSSTFNVLLVSLVGATAALLLIGVDFGEAFGRLGGPDILLMLLIGLASAAMFLVFRWLRTG